MDDQSDNYSVGATMSGSAVAALKSRLVPVVERDGWTLVWRDDETGRYWESRFEGRFDEQESLVCISDDEFNERWKHQ